MRTSISTDYVKAMKLKERNTTEEILRDKELFRFVRQFVQFGCGRAVDRLGKQKKCEGCDDDTRIIIEAVSKTATKISLKEVEKLLRDEHNSREDIITKIKKYCLWETWV